MRRLTHNILERSGYVVLSARDGNDALDVSESHAGPIHLLLTDVMMPGIGGREVAERLAVRRPAMRVLYMSGHTPDVVHKEGIKQGAPFLPKPFTTAELARKVREVLDSEAES